MRALRVAVTRTELGTRVVVANTHVTVGRHGREVDGAVETAGEGRKVDVESELLVEEVEGLVGRLVLQEVETRADVGTGLEGELERAAGGGDTVGTRVVRTVERAVLRAGRAIRAVGGVPLVTGVAVLCSRESSIDIFQGVTKVYSRCSRRCRGPSAS